jgi:dinuclear metal center YbgI/SA1388 family protein
MAGCNRAARRFARTKTGPAGLTGRRLPGEKMGIRVADIVDILEGIAPPQLAEKWDNIGLQLGHPDWPAERVWVALDPTEAVVTAACREGVNLLITHHPLIFSPLKSIDFSTPMGRLLHLAIDHRLAVVAAHTNLDSAEGGLNDLLARKVGLVDCRPLVPAVDTCGDEGKGQGLGRVGLLPRPMPLGQLTREIKSALAAGVVRMVGDEALSVSTVAVCTGSGSSLMDAFFSSGAQVYVSGDLRYHDARDAEARGVGLIDVGHFAGEHMVVDDLTRRLSDRLSAQGVAVGACRIEKDPFQSI